MLLSSVSLNSDKHELSLNQINLAEEVRHVDQELAILRLSCKHISSRYVVLDSSKSQRIWQALIGRISWQTIRYLKYFVPR